MKQDLSLAEAWTLLENINEGVIIVANDGVLHYANSAAKMMLALQPETTSLSEIHVSHNSIDWQSLLSPPTQLQVQTQNGRSLQIQAKPYTETLIQLLLTPINQETMALPDNTLQQLAFLTNISNEFDFDKKLRLIVDGLQTTGWNRVLITLRDQDFNPTNLFSGGISPEELQKLRLIPSRHWFDLFQNETFQQGACFFVPAESGWLQQHFGGAPMASPPEDATLWQPLDLLCVPLYDRQRQKIGMIGLDEPANDRRPDPMTLQTVELYAQFAASTIENTQLVNETLARSREFEILFEANKAISSTLEKESVLTLMGQHMVQAVSADGYTIYHWRPDTNELVSLQDYTRLPEKPVQAVGHSITINQTTPVYEVLMVQKPRVIQVSGDGPVMLNKAIWIDAGQPYTSAILPIVVAEESFGIIEIITCGDQPAIGDRDLQLLLALSNQANTVLETALIFEDTYERERFYNALGSVSLAINYTLEREQVLNLIGSESLRIFDADGAYIWQRQGDQFFGCAAGGFSPNSFIGTSVPVDDLTSFVSKVARGGESIYINHIAEAKDIDIHLPDATAVQAVLGVPFEQDGHINYVLILADRHTPNRFTDQDITRTTTFGVQVAIALQNANLFAELRQLNEELDSRVADRTQALNEESNRFKILLRITSELSASLDHDRVLSQALGLVNEVVDSTQGVIILLDQESDNLIFRATLGIDSDAIAVGQPSSIIRNQGLPGWIIENRSAVIVHDTNQDPRWNPLPFQQKQQSALGVPLISNEEVIGVLMLFHTKRHAFTNHQLDLVEAAAIQVASAINNANLYLLIRDQAERLGDLLRAEQIESAKNQGILESIADGVIVADENSTIILANMPACKILDIPRHQLIGKSVKELLGLYGHSGDSWITTIDHWSLQADRIEEWTYLADQLSIEDKFVSVHLSPVLAGHQFFGTVSIFRDITQEVEVDRLKSEFVSTVSHELRTPMTSIKGYADLMLMGAAGTMSDGQTRYLQVIKSNAERLHMLVNDLLDISRIETGKTGLDVRPIDVTQIISQVVDGHLKGRIQHEDKLISVKTEATPSLPLVQADQARVTQILTNLIDNAFNYTPENGTVTVKAWSHRNHVYISVIDTGIGISKENQKKIFDRFFRSNHADVQKVPGTGLGLAIVQSLIEMHGGKLTLDSDIGHGSAFTFSLPVVMEEGKLTA